MKTLWILPLVLAAACRPDDTDDTAGDGGSADGGASDGGSGDGGSGDGGSGDGGSGDGGSGGACEGLALLGDWVSQGDDISPLFQGTPFEYSRIEANFAASCAYAVTATTQGGDVYDLSGTFVAEAGSPGTLVQTQVAPYDATAEGIWQVDGEVLTFEVVQTKPDYGFTPPTPATGFGSTAGQGLSPGDNIQVYRRP